MKKIAATILALICLFQVIEQVTVISYFTLNRNYISSKLCVQRTATDNCCKGSCFLKKHLNTTDETDSGTTTRATEELTWYLPVDQLRIASLPCAVTVQHVCTTGAPGSSFTADIFHPPGA